ncbi:Z-ring formation inhibitor MciZ [Niallia nealsonii]|uniref:Z-ring formation inhibitor MciZ n=1 Tax=Niallia nealsonii TaxID=115979 RepID=A0A2N0YX94_9BACI|nr:Z-ring formation inhibitor MciZ [Niallia nealsonii]PKG21881.1 Z-ring formation inhibitor MciZ [Niallia nealsonii]
MKIYLHGKGIVCYGKYWEIKHLLKQYGKQYTYVKEWIEFENTKNINFKKSK